MDKLSAVHNFQPRLHVLRDCLWLRLDAAHVDSRARRVINQRYGNAKLCALTMLRTSRPISGVNHGIQTGRVGVGCWTNADPLRDVIASPGAP